MGTDMTQLSYTRGPQDNPLLAMTIGEAFDATVRLHARREALLTWQINRAYYIIYIYENRCPQTQPPRTT